MAMTTDNLNTLRLEVARVHALILLQTHVVLDSASVLMQLHDALSRDMVVACVVIAQGGYSFERAKAHLSDLAGCLEIGELRELRRFLEEAGLRLPAMSSLLASAIPKIMSMQFDPQGNPTDMEAFVSAFTERLMKLASKSASSWYKDSESDEVEEPSPENSFRLSFSSRRRSAAARRSVVRCQCLNPTTPQPRSGVPFNTSTVQLDRK